MTVFNHCNRANNSLHLLLLDQSYALQSFCKGKIMSTIMAVEQSNVV